MAQADNVLEAKQDVALGVDATDRAAGQVDEHGRSGAGVVEGVAAAVYKSSQKGRGVPDAVVRSA